MEISVMQGSNGCIQSVASV